MRKFLSFLLFFTAATTLGRTPLPQGPLTGGAPQSTGGRAGAANIEVVGGLGGRRDITVSVTQISRPLMEVARQISEQLNVMVSYEEPAWVAGPDLVSGATDKPKQPRPGTINVHAVLRDGDDEFKLAGQLLQESLDDNAARGNPGLFKLVKLGDYGYSIVGTNMRGENGEWLSTPSPLDARISFDEVMREDRATVLLIERAVTAVTHCKFGGHDDEVTDPVLLATLPRTSTAYQIKIGAQNEVARDVLGRVMVEMAKVRNAKREAREPIWQFRWDLFSDIRAGKDPAYILRQDQLLRPIP